VKYGINELSMFSDKRGWLIEILNGMSSQRIEQIHYSCSNSGAVRGNHYHKHRVEWLCVTSGTGRIVLEDNFTKERKELKVSGDSPVLIKIPPNIAHAIENIADAPMHLLVMADEKRSSTDSDTYHMQII
jgi:UDP-2-acetamido-2,6-beta-L-arabino-hexul-4-ose reductase